MSSAIVEAADRQRKPKISYGLAKGRHGPVSEGRYESEEGHPEGPPAFRFIFDS
jgi:hypothetical protein